MTSRADAMVRGFSLLIPTYNRAGYLERTLTHLRTLVWPAESGCEILVIDNNSNDTTPSVVEQFARGAPVPTRLIHETAQGLCHARNRGLKEAKYPYVVFFDDDVEVAPLWLQAYQERLDALRAECVFGPVEPVFEADVPAFISTRIRASISSPYSNKGDEVRHLSPDEAHEVPGCNFGVTRKMALELGGFDTRFDRSGSGLLAGGDSEFGMRMARAGRRVIYEPRCAVRHIITQEKLTRPYLRRRWYGMGATRRMLDEAEREAPSVGRITRGYLGILGLLLGALYCRLAAHPAAAFEKELEARRALGYWHAPQTDE